MSSNSFLYLRPNLKLGLVHKKKVNITKSISNIYQLIRTYIIELLKKMYLLGFDSRHFLQRCFFLIF